MPGPNVRYWTLNGDPEGRRFCFTITPLMVCPLASIDPDRPSGDEGSPWPKGVDEAAACLECAPADLAAILERVHRSTAGRRRDRQGRLTKDCGVCGARMDDQGYSAYVERDRRPDEDEDHHRASRAVASRIGFAPPTIRLKGVNGLKRSEARKWAWEQYTMAKAALQEEAR